MDIYLHNTLSDKKEVFTPITSGSVSMYNCGPTVYNYAHIGNFRTFIMSDLLRRMFEYNELNVTQVMNITDVDDKTIKRSQDENITLETLTQKYEKIFFDDLQTLNILHPHKTPRATESIEGMISFIEILLKKEIAYTTTDGIYLNIAKSKNYGTLARLDLHSPTQERITNDEYDKENARDFALWKFYSKDDGDVFYDAPFGKGRPGWHIECSAMSIKALGETIDIHTGGTDLIFPHHTNEIAQSEAITGKKFVNYWVHSGFITVESKKMSKSLGNIFTLADLKEKGFDPIAYRYFVLGAHYNTTLNFTWEALEGAQTAWKKIKDYVGRKDGEVIIDDKKSDSDNAIQEYRNKFNAFINDDLDTPRALALVFEILKDDELSHADKRTLILDFDRVFGLELDKVEAVETPQQILDLITLRDTARSEKDFAKSDEIREQIESLGFDVMDTPEGTKVSKK